MKAKENKYISSSSKTGDRYFSALNTLIAAAEAKEIYKARFDEAKKHVMAGIEHSYSKFFETIQKELVKDGIRTTDLWYITSVADIVKVNKVYRPMQPKRPEAIAFMDTIIGIPEAFKVIASYVKSGRPPKAPDPNKFTKPMIPMEADKLARAYMNDAVAEFKTDLTKSVEDQIQKAFEVVKDITTLADLKNVAKTDTQQFVAAQIFDKRYKDAKYVVSLKPAHKTILKKIVDTNVEDVVSGFVNKTTSKIALLFKKKSKVKQHQILNTRVNNGLVENTMRFSFDDGSSFDLVSAVVYGYTQGGKLFIRFPSRFTNVIMSDGSPMPSPSEEKMLEQF
jgi:hypothetical protein